MSPSQWSGPKLNRVSNALAVLALLLAVGVGLYFWQANAAQDRADEAQTTRLAVVELNGQNLATQLDGQRAQFEACVDAKPGAVGCDLPVAPPAAQVAPQIVTGPIGPQGYPGLDGAAPSTAQIAAAVATYLKAHPAPAGKDGVTPDPDVVTAQIRTAVALYLGANPPTDGTNGIDGTNGANATDTQIAAAVADYCAAHDGCRGPAGADGATGPAAPTPTPTPTLEPTPEPTPTATGGKP